MKKGFITNSGKSWVASNVDRNGFWETLGIKWLKPLVAWNCEKCNKIELSVEQTK